MCNLVRLPAYFLEWYSTDSNTCSISVSDPPGRLSITVPPQDASLEYMHPLIWLLLGVIFATVARAYAVVITPKGSVPRKRAHTETCHLAVFLGSGKPDAVRIRRPHPHA